jgi:hypothetical protein
VATTVASLRILLGLDSKDVKDGAGSVKSELKGIQGEAKKTQGALDDMKKGAAQGLGIGVGLGGFQAASAAVQQLTGFLTDAVKAAQEDEQSVAQLNASLNANAPLWRENANAIDAQIKAAQRLGFTDDEVRGSLSRLSAVTHDVNESLKIQQTAMDLARFKNISLESATQALVQVEAGRYRGLAALGINIKDIHNRTEALAAVQKVAAGSAEAWGKTSAGAAQEAGIAFGEAQESIGRGLLPVITELSHAVRDILAPALQVVADNLPLIEQAAAGVAIAFGVKMVLGVGAATAAIVAQEGVVGVLTAAYTALKIEAALAWIAQAGPAGLVAGGAFLAYLGITAAVNASNEAQKNAIPILADLAAQQQALDAQLVEGTITQDQYNASSDALVQKQRDAIAAAKDAKDAAASQAAGVTGLTGVVDTQTVAIDGLAGTHVTLTHNVDEATGAFADEYNRMNGLVPVAKDLSNAVLDLSATHTTLANNVDEKTAAMGDDFRAMQKPIEDTTGTVSDLQRAIDLLPSDVQIRIKVTTTAEAVGGHNVAEKIGTATDIATGAGDPSIAQGNADFIRDNAERQRQIDEARKRDRDRAAADAKAARDKAAADAKRAAAEAKRAEDELNRQRVEIANKTFDRMSDAAHKYFDDLHKANLKAIDDAQKAADAQIEAQKKANLQPATAAEARLRAVQQARQLASLQADLAAAKTPEERLRAQQALSDFQAQARIDFLRKQGEDANAILDETKKTQDQGFADQRDKENKRNQDQVNLFDENLKSLREYVGKHPAEWKKSIDKVAAVLKAAGVDYEKVGKENADAYIRGVNKGFAGFGVAAPGGKAPAAGASPALMASAGLIPVGGGVKGDVYLDGAKVGEFIERYLAANASATTSGYTARHN